MRYWPIKAILKIDTAQVNEVRKLIKYWNNTTSQERKKIKIMSAKQPPKMNEREKIWLINIEISHDERDNIFYLVAQ